MVEMLSKVPNTCRTFRPILCLIPVAGKKSGPPSTCSIYIWVKRAWGLEPPKKIFKKYYYYYLKFFWVRSSSRMCATHISDSDPHFRHLILQYIYETRPFRFTQMNITEHSSYESRSVFGKCIPCMHKRTTVHLWTVLVPTEHWVKGDRVNSEPVRVPIHNGIAPLTTQLWMNLDEPSTELPWLIWPWLSPW